MVAALLLPARPCELGAWSRTLSGRTRFSTCLPYTVCFDCNQRQLRIDPGSLIFETDLLTELLQMGIPLHRIEGSKRTLSYSLWRSTGHKCIGRASLSAMWFDPFIRQ